MDFFKREYVPAPSFHMMHPEVPFRFELDYLLASIAHPYVALMDGITSQSRTLRVPLRRDTNGRA